MKTTVEFLDAVKAKRCIPSDYALAPELSITRAMISRYRTGKDYFSDEIAIKVSNILEIDPAYVVACVHAERAKPSEEKKLWERIAAMMQTKEVTGIAAFLAVVAFLPMVNLDADGFNLAFAGLTYPAADAGKLYIMSNYVLPAG